MKVLHINYSATQGGAAVACNRLNEALKTRIYSKILTVHPTKDLIKKASFNDVVRYLIIKNLSRLFCKLYENKFNRNYSLNIFDNPIINKINKSNFDLINIHWIGNETISLKQISEIKKPIVWTLVDMWPFLGAEHINWKIKKKDYWNNEKILNSCLFNINSYILKKKIKYLNFDYKVIAISRWLKNIAKKSILFKKKNILIIPPTLDFNFWKSLNKKKSRNKLGIEKKYKIILFVSSAGTKDKKKGFDYLLDALTKINNKNKFLLLIAGELDEKRKKKINIPYKVINKTFFENKNELRILYSAADVLVVPSIVEAFGQVALESLSCNVPVVAFKNTGLEDIIIHKKNGFLAKYLNANSFCKGIKWCLDENNKNLIQIFCQKSISKFSNNKIVESYLKIYKKAIHDYKFKNF